MFRKRIMVRFIAPTMALAAFMPFLFAASPAHASGAVLSCRPVAPIDVTLSTTDPTVYHVNATLCAKGSLAGKTMQLLVHGLTYDRRYWNWPITPQDNSYTLAATNAGYATLAIDRIGDGLSSHPVDGNTVTLESGAYVLHQILQKLHTGAVSGTAFSRVAVVTHSYGAATTALESATYNDASGIILTGFDTQYTPGAFASLGDFHPVSQDPKWQLSGLNDTYITTVPGTRSSLFFVPPNVSPGTVPFDEAIKQTGTVGEVATIGDVGPTITPQINIPVLIANGQKDFIVCDETAGLSCANGAALVAREAANFNAHTCLEGYVLSNAGHDINMHKNANQWFDAANNWIAKRVGRDAAHGPTTVCP